MLVVEVDLVVEVMEEDLMVVLAALIVELWLVPGLVVVKLQVPKLMMVGILGLKEVVGVPSSAMIVGKGPAYQEDDIFSVMSTHTYISVINCLYNLF